MSIQINVYSSKTIIQEDEKRLIFSFDCSDQDYFIRYPEFISYPIKDAIWKSATITDDEFAQFFIIEIAIQANGLKVARRGIIARETTERVHQLPKVIEEVLGNNFWFLRNEMQKAYFDAYVDSKKEN